VRGRALRVVGACAAVLGGCDAGTIKQIGTNHPATSCLTAPAAPPAGFDGFYDKYLDARGVPVLSSAAVSDIALASACSIASQMLAERDDVRLAMIDRNMRIAILGRNEVTTQIPEYRNLDTMFPQQDWDRLRGVGATIQIPVASVGEENLLCLTNDIFAGEQILVQTFATAVLLGLEDVDDTYEPRLRDAYDAAIAAGLWRNTYSSANPIEYYAEGVQSWFDANLEVSPPDGTNGEINTRVELRSYDPTLADLIAESMLDDAWRPSCP
jgi:hypothetical protein